MLKHLKHTLQNSFEYNGRWWLPNSQQKNIGGSIYYANGERPRLELIGNILPISGEIGKPVKVDIIHGVTQDGINCTLGNCFGIIKMMSFPGFVSQSFQVGFLILGHHFDSVDEVVFHSYATNFQFLEDWLFGEPRRMGQSKGGRLEYTIHWAAGDLFKENISSIGGRISIKTESFAEETTSTNFQMQSNSYVIWEPDNPLHFDEFRKVFLEIQHFFSLMLGEGTFPRKIHGFIKRTQDDKELNWPVSIFYPHQSPIFNPPTLHRDFMLIPYKSISNNFVKLLNNCLGKANILGPTYSLFFGALSKPDMFIKNRFLNLVQALEIYHRVLFKGIFISKKRYKKISREIEGFIDTLIPDDAEGIDPNLFQLKKALNVKLEYGNEYFLRLRFLDLFDYIGEDLRELVTTGSAFEFSKNAVLARNGLIHQGKTHRYDDKKLVLLCHQLKILLLGPYAS